MAGNKEEATRCIPAIRQPDRGESIHKAAARKSFLGLCTEELTICIGFKKSPKPLSLERLPQTSHVMAIKITIKMSSPSSPLLFRSDPSCPPLQ